MLTSEAKQAVILANARHDGLPSAKTTPCFKKATL